MPLEITAIALCVVALGAMVTMLMIALTHITDPAGYSRCHRCARLMIDTLYRPRPLCVRCRRDRRDAQLLVARRNPDPTPTTARTPAERPIPAGVYSVSSNTGPRQPVSGTPPSSAAPMARSS